MSNIGQAYTCEPASESPEADIAELSGSFSVEPGEAHAARLPDEGSLILLRGATPRGTLMLVR